MTRIDKICQAAKNYSDSMDEFQRYHTYPRSAFVGVETSPDTYNEFREFLCKPYLFPLSSMTEEQKEEFKKTTIRNDILTVWTTSTYDWLNKNHFDYRRLIEKGLAIDATGKNIY